MTPDTPTNIASLIDHTLLKPDATRSDILRLCDEAVRFGFATVCVNPTWVGEAARRLFGSPVRVCSVGGFPLGATPALVKVYEARQLIGDGAAEIDMVINVGALKSGDVETIATEVQAVVEACHEGPARIVSKVIIECGLLTDDEKATACSVIKTVGADYIKTSTGFGSGGATVADVALIRRVAGPAMGIKAAGGIRDLSTLRAMVAAGATRIGTSAGIAIVEEARRTAGA